MNQAVAVNDYDRFSFAIFVAAIVHLLLIFGIGFSLPEKQSSATTLDVTLAQSHQADAPEEADFLAQSNQEGSGTLEERAEMTTTDAAEYASEIFKQTQHREQEAKAPKFSKQDYRAITSTGGAYSVNSHQLSQDIQSMDLPVDVAQSFWERSLEIASLEAKYDHQVQTFSKKPRIRRLTASSTRASVDALYMNQWLNRIHRIGNINYPAEAKRQNISGSLRLLVSVKADGTIHELKVLDPSGHKVLDDAAKHIVRLAAPFAPFSEEMREKSDILEIIRTWQFVQTQFSTKS